jgi:hypothetical protein
MELFRLSDQKMSQIINVWQEIADQNNGKFRYILCISPAGIDPINNKIKKFELLIPSLHNSKIEFNSSEKHPLKVRFQFKKQLNYEFQIFPEDFIEKISKLLGSKEIEIGVKDFDNKYILKSNDEDFIKYLFDEEARTYLQSVLVSSINLGNKGYSVLELTLSINEENKNEMIRLLAFIKQFIIRIDNWKR